MSTPDMYLTRRWDPAKKAYLVVAQPVEVGGGGAFPSCVLAREFPFDIRTTGDHPVVWDVLYDNYSDFNLLTAIPDGLGLNFSFDDSSADITTTVAGVWSFSFNFAIPADANWAGVFESGWGKQTLLPATVGASLALTRVLPIALGVTFTPRFTVSTQALSNPYTCTGVGLIVTRLG